MIDKSQSINIGTIAENKFAEACQKIGITCVKSNTWDDINLHVDFTMILKDKKRTVDVKARRKHNRYDNNFDYDMTWIELTNVQGKKGWAYGSEYFLAFELEDSFLLFKREDVLNFTLNKMTGAKGKDFYQTYQRSGRKDEIVKVSMIDMRNEVEHKIILK